jgi:hypothetical protein
LHYGKDVSWREARDYGLEELGRVENGFARGVWSAADVMLRGGDTACGLALLFARSVLRALQMKKSIVY